MNALLPLSSAKSSVNPARAAAVNATPRSQHRERDFGVGYGNSSGYASARRYTSDWAPARFRFA
ncbi:MAG: hypothetical protein HOQ33_00055 [Cupriavidus sp.]|nr:hypothetical protein [Cupriavidus sp.]